MTDQNAGRRVLVRGTSTIGYSVYTIEPDGKIEELPCRSVTVEVHRDARGETQAVAMVYFTSPLLDIEAPRHADGVRAG